MGRLRRLQKVFEAFSGPVVSPAEGLREVGLRIAVDEQHSQAGLGEQRSEIRGRRGLGDTPLVVRQDDHESRAPVFTDVLTIVFTAARTYVFTSNLTAVFLASVRRKIWLS